MFVNDSHEKIFQTLPGQGWQALIDWNDPEYLDDGHPRYTLEPVIAWVTAKIIRTGKHGDYEDIIIAGLVRWPASDELVLLDSRGSSERRHVYLAPGEPLTDEHFAILEGGYRKGVDRANV